MNTQSFTDTKSLYKDIRRECALAMGNETQAGIARKFEVSPRTVTRAVREDKDCPKFNAYPIPDHDMSADIFFEAMSEHIEELKELYFTPRDKVLFLQICIKLREELRHDELPTVIDALFNW